MFLIDSHCHLHQLDYKNTHINVDDVLHKANQRGVQLVLSVGTNISDYNDMIKCIGQRKNILYSCGIHPVYAYKEAKNFNKKILYNLLSQQNVVAVGETGLDYYHTLEYIEQQKNMFREHIRIAIQVKKPVIIHSRNASKDMIMILKEENINQCMGILHCFSEDIDCARILLNLNCFISFSGMVTFSKSYKIQQAIKYVPLDRILLETDSPYLTPVPYRGTENQPAYVYEIAKYIAYIKNISIDQLACITTDNFYTLFCLEK